MFTTSPTKVKAVTPEMLNVIAIGKKAVKTNTIGKTIAMILTPSTDFLSADLTFITRLKLLRTRTVGQGLLRRLSSLAFSLHVFTHGQSSEGQEDGYQNQAPHALLVSFARHGLKIVHLNRQGAGL